MIGRLQQGNPKQFEDQAASIEKINFHLFKPQKYPQASNPPSNICQVHPKADPKVKALSFEQRELVFHETRGHGGCFKAVGMYQFFFGLMPPGQKISIQLTNEEPILVHTASQEVFQLRIKSPKSAIIASIPSIPLSIHGGQTDGESHVILGFPHPNKPNEHFVVDMSRMQYGEAGRGTYKENYFLGTRSAYKNSMKSICEDLTLIDVRPSLLATESENSKRIKALAEKVWKRWQNRASESWCDFCGKSGDDLKNCGACKKVIVKYCCKEHQKAGWKLHKFTCEKGRQ